MANLIVWLSVGLGLSASARAEEATVSPVQPTDVAGMDIDQLVYDQTLLSDTPASAHQTYALLSAMVGYAQAWRGHKIDLHLMGKNLADEHYRPSQSTRGRPREILLRLTASL